MGSSSTQIEQWIHAHKPATVRFFGVRPNDELPDPHSFAPGSALVVNYDPSNKDGSHWCAVVWPSSGRRVWWVDSFGTPPDWDDRILHDRSHFRKWLVDVAQAHGADWTYNAFDFQSLQTSVCGHYAALSCAIGPPGEPYDLRGARTWTSIATTPQPQRDDVELKRIVRFA